MSKTRSYKEDLLKALTDPIEAREYLNAALEDENPEVFLLALRDVVEANSTMSELAKATNRNRESLYKTLSEKGNPQLNSVRTILDNLGFKLAVDNKTQNLINKEVKQAIGEVIRKQNNE